MGGVHLDPPLSDLVILFVLQMNVNRAAGQQFEERRLSCQGQVWITRVEFLHVHYVL